LLISATDLKLVFGIQVSLHLLNTDLFTKSGNSLREKEARLSELPGFQLSGVNQQTSFGEFCREPLHLCNSEAGPDYVVPQANAGLATPLGAADVFNLKLRITDAVLKLPINLNKVFVSNSVFSKNQVLGLRDVKVRRSSNEQ